MRFKKLNLIFFVFIFFSSCVNNNLKTPKNYIHKDVKSYSGFVLIYDEDLYKTKIVSKRLSNSGNFAIHQSIKKNTILKVTNPYNNKSINIKVVSNVSFPNIYKLVINKKTSNYLELNLKEPFVEFSETKFNETFIARKAEMYEEEKKVAKKAPVKAVKVENISNKTSSKNNVVKKTSKEKLYLIIISDFYYQHSAKNLFEKLKKEKNIDKLTIKKVKNNKFRLSCGPFKSFMSLKDSYLSLNSLGFEDLDINIIEK